MFLVNTPPQISDAYFFVEMSRDRAILDEFTQFNFDSLLHAEEYLRHRLENSSTKYFLKVIRIAFAEDIDIYTEDNSIPIGFISMNWSSLGEEIALMGLQNHISFAMIENYRGKGLMTKAMIMLLDAMLTDGYNMVPSITKNNIPSERVLIKCGFQKARSTPLGNIFVKRLKMDETKFNSAFFIE